MSSLSSRAHTFASNCLRSGLYLIKRYLLLLTHTSFDPTHNSAVQFAAVLSRTPCAHTVLCHSSFFVTLTIFGWMEGFLLIGPNEWIKWHMTLLWAHSMSFCSCFSVTRRALGQCVFIKDRCPFFAVFHEILFGLFWDLCRCVDHIHTDFFNPFSSTYTWGLRGCWSPSHLPYCKRQGRHWTGCQSDSG